MIDHSKAETTDWLIRGISKKQLRKEKKQALRDIKRASKNSGRRFATKTIFGSAVFIIIGVAMSMIFNNAIINNYIAMGQMSNSNEAYLIMEYYNKFKVVAGSVYGLFFVLFAGKTIYNFYKIIKEKMEMEE